MKSYSSKFKIILIISIFFFGIFGLAKISHAATYYVATTGSDSSSGSSSAPFKTIQKAADIVSAGDTVYVRGGTYANVWVHQKNGTSSAWIAFKPYPGETVIIDTFKNGRYENGNNCFTLGGSSYLEINGFRFTSSDPRGDSQEFSEYSQTLPAGGIKIDMAGGVYSSHIKIYNNTFYHLGGGGIGATKLSHNVEIAGNNLYNIGLSHRGYCMYLQGYDYLVSKNIMHDCYGHALHVYSDYAEQPYNFTVEKNIAYNSGHSDYGAGYSEWGAAGVTAGDGLLVWANNSTVKNNIVYGNLGDGIDINRSTDTVYNNTSYNNDGRGLNIKTSGHTIRNNISYLNGSGDNIISGNTASNNLNANPNFINASSSDFHLASNSPAINAGYLVTSVTDDYDGNSRPQGSGYDIGAYEYGGVPSDTTAPATPTGVKAN
jgi:hypothetical protein